MTQGKLGWAFDQFAIYVSGGLAIAHSNTIIVENVSFSPSIFEYDSTDTGWTVGGGGDYMISNNVSVGFSYNYIDLETSRNVDDGGLFNANTFGSEVDAEMHVVRLKLDHHIGN